MKLDFASLPENLDALHFAFIGVAIIELVLLVVLLCLIVIGLLRKNNRPAESAPSIEKPGEAKILQPAPAEAKAETKPAPQTATLKEASPDAALQLLGLLQQEARFIDFVEEDIQSFSDAEIGAAARVVHQGCHKVLHNHFQLAPVRSETENSRITVKKGFDPSSIRLTGNIVGKAPFKGTLVHRGWKITDISLPKLAENHNVSVVAAAEVEL